MVSFLLDNTASEVPDAVEPVEIMYKRPGNLHLVFQLFFVFMIRLLSYIQHSFLKTQWLLNN